MFLISLSEVDMCERLTCFLGSHFFILKCVEEFILNFLMFITIELKELLHERRLIYFTVLVFVDNPESITLEVNVDGRHFRLILIGSIVLIHLNF